MITSTQSKGLQDDIDHLVQPIAQCHLRRSDPEARRSPLKADRKPLGYLLNGLSSADLALFFMWAGDRMGFHCSR